MEHKLTAIFVACATAAAMLMSGGIAHAQTAETPLQFERGYPTAVTAEKAYDATDLRRAIEAYKFFYATMGSETVMQQMLTNGAKINEIGHVMATWPRIQFGAANSDTPYRRGCNRLHQSDRVCRASVLGNCPREK